MSASYNIKCMGEQKVRQCGVVESVNGNVVRVRCVRLSACDTCSASSSCRTVHGKAMYVDVHDTEPDICKVGDRVIVETGARSARDAVLLGFVWPLVAFVVVLAFASVSGTSDCVAAFYALMALAAYYILLYALRTRVGQCFSFRIVEVEKTNTMTI